jgi:hypothetical protein
MYSDDYRDLGLEIIEMLREYDRLPVKIIAYRLRVQEGLIESRLRKAGIPIPWLNLRN